MLGTFLIGRRAVSAFLIVGPILASTVDVILLDRAGFSLRRQARPGIRIETAGRLEPVCRGLRRIRTRDVMAITRMRRVGAPLARISQRVLRSISSFMSAAVPGAEARFLPDVVGSVAALIACASSVGEAPRDAACLATCLAACAASEHISAAATQSRAALQAPAARLPIRNVPSI